MTIGFVVWNPFQVFHMGPIADHLDDAMFVVINRGQLDAIRADFGGSVGSFIRERVQIVTPRRLVSLDGEIDAFVCPNPFPGMNALVSSRRIGIQYSMTKESYQYGTWRSQFDLNLAYGEYSAQRLLRYGPAVGVGNPRFAPWFNREIPTDADRPHLREDRKTIIYLPTWGEFSSVPTFLPALEQMRDDYEIIVKLHHKSYLTEPDKARQLASTSLDQGLRPHDDLLPLLARADLVISDYSGAIFDALYVRKPVLLLQPDPARLVGPKFTFDSIEYARRDEIGPVVDTPDHLKATVAEILDGSLDYSERNEALRSECFAEDVKAAERCAEVIESAIVHRRNPRSPRSSSTRAILQPDVPVQQRVARLRRSLEEPSNRSRQRDKTSASKQVRHVVKRTAQAVRAAPMLGAAAISPLPLSPGSRQRLTNLTLRLSDDSQLALKVLRGLHRRGVLTVQQQLRLAELLYVHGEGHLAARVVAAIPPTDRASRLLELLASVYRELDGAAATWNALSGLEARQPTPTVQSRQIATAVSTVTDVLCDVAAGAAAAASARGEFDLAADIYAAALEVNDDLPSLHYHRGVELENAFRFGDAEEAYTEALRRSPFSENHRRALVRLYSKMERWEDARRTARTPRRESPIEEARRLPGATSLATAIDLLDQAFVDPTVAAKPDYRAAVDRCRPIANLLTLDYWMTLHWRLIRAGAFSAAYGVKDLAALSVLNDLSLSKQNDVRSTILLAKALLTLQQADEARELLELRLRYATDERSRMLLSKAVADVAFFEGDPSAAQQWHQSTRSMRFHQPRAHARARELFHAQRIAIVGPGARPASSDDDLSAYDTIIRTNLVAPTTAGRRRVDVVYFNSGITRLGLDDLLDASSQQDVQQVILRRPRDLQRLAPRLETGALRFVDAEPGCHLLSSSFGVQRIIYDIAFYGPKSVDVLNIDFFTGDIEYEPGYKVENADVSFRGYSHDFRGDFLLSQQLARSGAVRFDALASQILRSDVDQYLSILDSKLEV